MTVKFRVYCATRGEKLGKGTHFLKEKVATCEGDMELDEMASSNIFVIRNVMDTVQK